MYVCRGVCVGGRVGICVNVDMYIVCVCVYMSEGIGECVSMCLCVGYAYKWYLQMPEEDVWTLLGKLLTPKQLYVQTRLLRL